MFQSITSGTLEVLSGDLQLLIPEWRFSSAGYVAQWLAMVQGSASNSAGIELQIFRPIQNEEGIQYGLVYGNELPASQGSIILPRFVCLQPGTSQIPVQPGDIVGIRLKNGTDLPSFGLQYRSGATTGDRVDVYYWQGMGNQACNLSICDSNAGVLRGIIPLISWEFCK